VASVKNVQNEENSTLVREELINNWAVVIRCKVEELPINYIGFPLGGNPNRLNTWRAVVDKVKKKLTTWKRNTLSIGGRHTLILLVIN